MASPMRYVSTQANHSPAFSPSFPQDPQAFYRELTTRHRHFVSPETQKKLSELRILIAGCGSTGGACIEALARLGVTRFILADNGEYELNNLNRQHALLENLGENKAVFHAKQLKGINPFAEVEVHSQGITLENVGSLVNSADLIMDAVDVTTPGGIAMKLALHEYAHTASKAVFTALDIGFCQWGHTYDYRDPEVAVLDGKLEEARQAKHPLKALFTIVPLSTCPAHSLPLIEELLLDPSISASQLGGTSDLLSAIIVSSVIRFAETGEAVAGWRLNLEYLAMPLSARLKWAWRGLFLRPRVARLLRETG